MKVRLAEVSVEVVYAHPRPVSAAENGAVASAVDERAVSLKLFLEHAWRTDYMKEPRQKPKVNPLLKFPCPQRQTLPREVAARLTLGSPVFRHPCWHIRGVRLLGLKAPVV